MPRIAIAEAVARCRPQVVCAYPSAFETTIVDTLARLVTRDADAYARIVRCESPAAALSAALGASASGARTYLAASGCDVLAMAQPLYDAAAFGLPVVMTIAHRALAGGSGSDHSDSMAMRDAGWIQLYATSTQDAVDLHVQAFRLAEELACPVMVCVDADAVVDANADADVPPPGRVDAFLPRYEPPCDDDAASSAIAAPIGAETFTEIRYLAHHKQLRALQLIPQLAASFATQFGRASGGLLRAYRASDAETIVVALGSTNAVVTDVVDDLRDAGERIGSIAIASFRPFPLSVTRDALQHAKRVVVLEKSLAIGHGGVVSDGVRKALADLQVRGYTVIAGLGGRTISPASLRQLFVDAAADELEQLTFLDLNAEIVARELAREKQARRGRTR